MDPASELARVSLVLFALLCAPASFADPVTRADCLAQLRAGALQRRELLPGRVFDTYKTIRPPHRKEWLSSGVRPELVDRVVVSLPDVACDASSPELRYPIAAYLGLPLAEHVPTLQRSGWLVRQLDPSSGRTLPSQVKLDAGFRHGHHKYEDPAGERPEVAYLDVPDAIARRVYERHGVRNARGPFWQVVRQRKLPLLVTEGAKKAASLLSLGYAAISLPGVCLGISMRDDKGWSHDPTLRRGLAAMLQPGVDVRIVFDHDDTEVTRRFVRTVLTYTAVTIEQAGAHVRVVELPGPDKGVDDFIVAQGGKAFSALYDAASPFADWRRTHGDVLLPQAIYDIGGCD